ncbi:MAG: cobyric acid synthase [Alphaproteobacteria bacterium]|nr:cobyric acid synthase [Alphaproteobacteria bacterium]
MTAAPDTPAIMFQGTGSDVGKSLLVAGLARAFTRRGLKVAPFKPQNMSNNAAVTPDGGEIGRAQALQARACGRPSDTDMNPILLKPQTDLGSQIIVQGKVFGTAKARDYYGLKQTLLPKALESFDRLAGHADLVLVEGAGSPAEINLRAGDIANMGFAEAADLPVILVADIDRGGVIASVVGTHAVLDAAEQERLRGYLINKFRGDISLFDDGISAIGSRTGLDCLGVLPWFPDAVMLPAEDAVAIDRGVVATTGTGQKPIRIVVPRLSRIANFDDLDPLRGEADVSVEIVPAGKPLPGDADLILLPGSKATIADLEDFRRNGWDIDLLGHLRRGGRVLGLCAGYQMLGRTIADPQGIEGPPGTVDGLSLLDVDTVLQGPKRLVEATGRDLATGQAISGYEMHMGRTTGPGCDTPAVEIDGRPDGAVSANGQVSGCYLHGIFASDAFRAAYLAQFRQGRDAGSQYEATVERTLDRLADHLEQHCDLDRMLFIARSRTAP